jgi:hypothetical protein
MLHVEDVEGFFQVDNMCGEQNLLHSELEKHIDIVEVNHTITSSVARFNESVVKFRKCPACSFRHIVYFP